MEIRGPLHGMVILFPAKDPGTHWIGGWVSPSAVVGNNPLPQPEIEPRSFVFILADFLRSRTRQSLGTAASDVSVVPDDR
jgi:hypothetical protein